MPYKIGGFSKDQYLAFALTTPPKSANQRHWISSFNLIQSPYFRTLINRVAHFFQTQCREFPDNALLLARFQQHVFSTIKTKEELDTARAIYENLKKCQGLSDEDLLALEKIDKMLKLLKIPNGIVATPLKNPPKVQRKPVGAEDASAQGTPAKKNAEQSPRQGNTKTAQRPSTPGQLPASKGTPLPKQPLGSNGAPPPPPPPPGKGAPPPPPPPNGKGAPPPPPQPKGGKTPANQAGAKASATSTNPNSDKAQLKLKFKGEPDEPKFNQKVEAKEKYDDQDKAKLREEIGKIKTFVADLTAVLKTVQEAISEEEKLAADLKEKPAQLQEEKKRLTEAKRVADGLSKEKPLALMPYKISDTRAFNLPVAKDKALSIINQQLVKGGSSALSGSEKQKKESYQGAAPKSMEDLKRDCQKTEETVQALQLKLKELREMVNGEVPFSDFKKLKVIKENAIRQWQKALLEREKVLKALEAPQTKPKSDEKKSDKKKPQGELLSNLEWRNQTFDELRKEEPDLKREDFDAWMDAQLIAADDKDWAIHSRQSHEEIFKNLRSGV